MERPARQPVVLFGDAYLNEMEITERLFPTELTALCNTVSDFLCGEAAEARERFQKLSPAQREDLFQFLRSL